MALLLIFVRTDPIMMIDWIPFVSDALLSDYDSVRQGYCCAR